MTPKCVIVGAGPVGSTLAAVTLALCLDKRLLQGREFVVIDGRPTATRIHGLKIDSASIRAIKAVFSRHFGPDSSRYSDNVRQLTDIFNEWERTGFTRTNVIEESMAAMITRMGGTLLRGAEYKLTKENMRERFSGTNLVIGADGAHSLIQTEVMGGQQTDKEELRQLVELKNLSH